jgi:hypothetical protein
MTEEPKKAARGEEASRMSVNTWDVCYRSETPLTVAQIADELTARGLRQNTDAVLLYKRNHSSNGELDGLWTNESPPQEVLDVAWREYVADTVRELLRYKRLTSTKGPGGNPHDPDRAYVANRNKPPMVYRSVVVVQRKLVPYDPEYRDKANEAQTAGLTFLERLADLEHRRNKPAADIREMLDLAATAIRSRTAS